MSQSTFFSPIRLLYSTNKLSDIEKLLFIAAIGACFFLFAAGYNVDSDIYLFFRYTDALAYGPQLLNSDTVRYDIIYPFFLWLSGYPYHHSLIGISIINAILAMVMPVLVYLTVRPIFSKYAYYIALAFIATLAPFYYIKWIRPDHIFMFFTILSVCLLSQFIDNKKPAYLYAMTVAVICASLSRSAGNILFPFFITTAYLFGRGSLPKYIISILIFTCVFSAYSYHRHVFFSQFGNLSSFNGGQTFQNAYVNSREYGIRLSPDLGPAMQTITTNFYQKILPSPSKSAYLQPDGNHSRDEFIKEYIYPVNADAFIKQIFETPCRDYYDMLYGASNNDSLFFHAFWEVTRNYPWYPIAYTSKNIWHLLYLPGYAHTKYNIHPFSKTGLEEAFPLFNEPNLLPGLHPQTMKEIEFDTLMHKPFIVSSFITHLKNVYCRHYIKAVQLSFYLIVIAWIACGLDLLSRFLPSKRLRHLTNTIMPCTNGALIITAITLYLFLSMFIIGFFVDPMLRFHNHLVPFKLMLAGIGACLIANVIWPQSQQHDQFAAKDELALKQYKTAAILLPLMIVFLLSCWCGYILACS